MSSTDGGVRRSGRAKKYTVDYAATEAADEDDDVAVAAPAPKPRGGKAKAAASAVAPAPASTSSSAAAAPAPPAPVTKWERHYRRLQSLLSTLRYTRAYLATYAAVREKEAAMAAAAAPAPMPSKKKGGKKSGASVGLRRPSSELLEARRKLVELKKKARAIVFEMDAEGAGYDKWNMYGAYNKGPSTTRAACAPVAGAMAQRARDDAAAKAAAAGGDGAGAAPPSSATAAAPPPAAYAAAVDLPPAQEDGIEAEEIACSACGRYDADDDDDILLCDYAYCGCAFHQSCCDPPLAALPPENVDWCCPRVSEGCGCGGEPRCLQGST